MSGYVKGCGWHVATLLGCLALAVSAQAASFDCAKASTKVEKTICSDAELSKQDEEMAALYAKVLQESSDNTVLKQTQRDWLKYRETCFAPEIKNLKACFSYVYKHHIHILQGSLATAPVSGKNINKLCAHIAVLVETGEANKLEPKDWENNPPRGTVYKSVDIDGDGIVDSVKTGCGSGECGLEVKLSSGGEFDLGDSPFYLIRYQSSIYALVSYTEDDESKDSKISTKYHLGRLYRITPIGAKMVCGK